MLRQPLRYPGVYAWFVLFASLDVMVTWIVLSLGGIEANAIAAWAIDHGGLAAMLALKFSVVAAVVIICQWVGQHRDNQARRLAEWAVALNSIPITVGAMQLAFVSVI